MSATASAAELLAAVEASPRAVAAHDRAAWVGLFAPGATVEDPVGSSPHTGRAAIERFYDTFIGPNGIAFRVEHDVVCGMTVYRDLVIETTMSTGVTLRVPMHLRYDLERVDGELKILTLHAHWELPTMIAQLLGAGVRGLAAGAKLTPQLLGNQGVRRRAGVRPRIRAGRRAPGDGWRPGCSSRPRAATPRPCAPPWLRARRWNGPPGRRWTPANSSRGPRGPRPVRRSSRGDT